MSEQKGRKDDSEKVDFSLISVLWLTGVFRVMTFGKIKYGSNNWRGGLQTSRTIAGSLRHIFLWLCGQDYDYDSNCSGCQEKTCKVHSGEHHLDAASCGIMMTRETCVTRPELDDRYKYDTKTLETVSEMFNIKRRSK